MTNSSPSSRKLRVSPLGKVSGVLPVVGVPLPFISYGGTAMVTLGLALGVLMSVARAQRLSMAEPKHTL